MEPGGVRFRFIRHPTGPFAVSDSHDTPEYIAVVCPVCATRLYPQVFAEPSEEKCPDCFTMVRVPALSAVTASRRIEQQRVEQRRVEVGTYGISHEDDDVRRRVKTGEPELVRIKCPHCSAELTPELKDTPQHVTCSDCLEILDIPSRSQARLKFQTRRRKKKRPPETAATYSLPEAEAPPRQEPARPMSFDSGLADAEAEIRREPPPPVPRWTFFTGVFQFPWRAGVLSRWAYMSFGFTVMGLVVGVIMWAWAEMKLALPFFALPVIWLTFLTLSYAAACWSAVLEDTAAGNDEIHNWPEPNWREWFAKMIYLAFIAGIAGFAAWGVGLIGKASGGNWGFWLTFGAVLFVTYPVVLLSSLEADSPWVPLTRPIFASMGSLWWGWLTYYALSAVLLAAYLAPLIAGVRGGFVWLTFLLTGPVAATVVLIHARLMGRLAWRGIVHPSETEYKRRRKRKANRRRESAVRH